MKNGQIMLHTFATLTCFLAVACTCHAASPIHRNNVLTARHVVVPGTHVALVPPPGATPAVRFRGFEIPPLNASLRVMEKMGVSYAKSERELVPQVFEADGIKITDRAKATLNGRSATLFEGTIGGQEGSAGLLLFVTGDENLTTQIYGLFPEGDQKARRILREALLSMIFRPQQDENGGGLYRLSTGGTEFKFAGETNMTRHYTLDGAPPSGTIETALYTVTVITETLVPENEREDFTRRRMGKYMAELPYTISGMRKITLAGLPGIELVADFSGASRRTRTASGARVNRTSPGKSFLTILFDSPSNTLYSFNGLAVRSSEKYLAQFRQMTSSFMLEE